MENPEHRNPISADISGIYETHLPVASLSRAKAFYQDILGLELARDLPERRVSFYWVGAPETSMLGLWESGSAPLGMRLHFAFRTGKEALLTLPRRLEQSGVQPLGFHGEAVEEPVVIGWMPALTLYCKDPDGHSVEFITKLQAPADPGFGIQSYSGWNAR